MNRMLDMMRSLLILIACVLIILSVAFVGESAGFAAWCMSAACCALVLYQF